MAGAIVDPFRTLLGHWAPGPVGNRSHVWLGCRAEARTRDWLGRPVPHRPGAL